MKTAEDGESATAMIESQKGLKVFNLYYASCLKTDTKLVGPAIVEMALIYKSNKSDLQKWIKNASKK